MEVGVIVEAEDLLAREKRNVAKAHFVLVCADENMRTLPGMIFPFFFCFSCYLRGEGLCDSSATIGWMIIVWLVLVFVKITVPPVIPETDQEKRRFNEAELRRKLRNYGWYCVLEQIVSCELC